MALVHGTVAPGYEKVREVFAAELARLGDLGAQLAVHRHGPSRPDPSRHRITGLSPAT